MIDLVCKRYPGRRPSDYLDIEDEVLAFKIDSAIAVRGILKETDERGIMMESIHRGFANVCRALGAKVNIKPYKPLLKETKGAEKAELPKIIFNKKWKPIM